MFGASGARFPYTQFQQWQLTHLCVFYRYTLFRYYHYLLKCLHKGAVLRECSVQLVLTVPVALIYVLFIVLLRLIICNKETILLETVKDVSFVYMSGNMSGNMAKFIL